MSTSQVADAKRCACGSDAIESEVLKSGQPGYGTHYAKLVCCDCGKFNGWARDPKVTAAFEKRAEQIQTLLARADLTAWKRDFLLSIASRRHLTERQAQTWESIRAKHS